MSKLYGLVVCGGESSRMGMDKSLLVYYNQPQRYHLYAMLQNICEEVFISCNEKQAAAIPEAYQKVVDLKRYEQIGPMAALLSAFAAHSDADFLVLACDCPFITRADMQKLVEERDQKHLAVCYANPETEVEEPLIALYSKNSYPHLIHHFNRKDYSLRHFLKDVHAKKTAPASPAALMSIDTPETYQDALAKINLKA